MTDLDYTVAILLAVAIIINIKAIRVSKRMDSGFEITIDEDDKTN